MIYYINIYIIFCYIACMSLVCCISAMWYAPQAQQARNKARQHNYMVVIHRLWIKLWITWLRLILLWISFGRLWIKQNTCYTLYPEKHIAIKAHFIMQKCVFYAFFDMFRWEIFWTPKGQIMRVIYIIRVFLCRKWGYFPKMEKIYREKIA